MKISISELVDYYIADKDEIFGWIGFTYTEGDSAESSYLLIQTFEEPDDEQV